MRTQIPVPSKGDGLRASWGAAVASRVNELCAMAPTRMLARDGFGGMGAQPLPQNLRDRRSAGPALPGCWRLETEADEEDPESVAIKLVACWYNVGGITKLADDIDVTSLLSSPEGEDPVSGILCAIFEGGKSPTAMLYADTDALAAAQEEETQYIVPLYQIAAGAAVLDMRNAPQIQVFEGTL